MLEKRKEVDEESGEAKGEAKVQVLRWLGDESKPASRPWEVKPWRQAPEIVAKSIGPRIFYHGSSTCATPAIGHAFWPL